MKKKLRPQEADAQVDSLGILQVSAKEVDNMLVASPPEKFMDMFFDLGEQDGCVPMVAPPKGPSSPGVAA